MRDVPLYDPSFGDAAQVFEVFSYLGYLAGVTQNILLGTAAVVLPIREPLLTLKSAATVQRLSGNRLLLGVALWQGLGWGQAAAAQGSAAPAALAVLGLAAPVWTTPAFSWTAVLSTALAPTLAVVLAVPLLGERVSRAAAIGVALSAVGVAFVMYDAGTSDAAEGRLVGNLLIIGGAWFLSASAREVPTKPIEVEVSRDSSSN